MKKQILLIAALAALAATSCSKNELERPDTKPGQITVTTTIAGTQSKGVVESNATELTDAAFVHAQVAAAANPVSFAGATAIAGNRAATGDIKFATAQLYDKATGKISYLMGYHPAEVATADIVTWTPDGATDILVTNLWNAGTYLVPVTTGMAFNHALARIEVKTSFAAGSSSAAVADTWGKIKDIVFKDAPTTVSLNYATNAVAAGATLANFSLLNGATYTVGAFSPVDITATADVVAAAMITPTDLGTFTLIATTEKLGEVLLPITLDASAKIEPGKIYTATIEFNAQNKAVNARVTTITAWKPVTPAEKPVPLPVKGPVIEFGKAPHAVTTGLTRGGLSYNKLIGENAANPGTNGSYYTSETLAYAGEPPYPRLEIDLTDIYAGTAPLQNWRQLKGTTEDICKARQGPQWRMPRFSELTLINMNATTLNATGGGYVAMTSGGTYWSATEYSGNNALGRTVSTTNPVKTTSTYRVRCVRELPLPESVVLEYGKAPHNNISGIPSKTHTSYRALYGENAANPGTNGRYYADLTSAFAGEPPYHEFEVAATDILDGNGAPLAMTWRVAQRTAFDDNICALERGPGWRLPRASEMQLIVNNATTMAKMGLQPFVTGGFYCTATEAAASTAFSVSYNGGNYRLDNKGTIPNYVRCVKELPVPPPVILESGKAPYNQTGEVGTATTRTSYYNGWYGENTGSDPLTYTNGKYYATKELAYAGEPPYYKFEIAREYAYDAVANDKNWKALQGAAANHIDNICVQKHGDGWRLPRLSELRLMYENKVELNKAVGFTDLAASYYWSATENGTGTAWFVDFSDGYTYGYGNKSSTASKARCVREIMP